MKFNKKQKKIMKIGATVLFSIALVLILNLLFNKKNTESYIGVWKIGYKYHKDTFDGEIISQFTQELHLLKDNTFYTSNKTDDESKSGFSVTGTYKKDGDKITLIYKTFGAEKTETLFFKDGKLCLTQKCEKYYSKDKIEKYYELVQKTNSDGEN